MPVYSYDHIHLRSRDPLATAKFYERMFGAKVLESVQSDGATRVDLDINGLGRLDERSRLDFFISATHAALFEDNKLIVQTAIPAGSFPFANQPLKAYFTHYLYHSDADIVDLLGASINSAPLCYPLNSYWFNDPEPAVTGRRTPPFSRGTANPAKSLKKSSIRVNVSMPCWAPVAGDLPELPRILPYLRSQLHWRSLGIRRSSVTSRICPPNAHFFGNSRESMEHRGLPAGERGF